MEDWHHDIDRSDRLAPKHLHIYIYYTGQIEGHTGMVLAKCQTGTNTKTMTAFVKTANVSNCILQPVMELTQFQEMEILRSVF